MKKINLAGKRFGRWSVLRQSEEKGNRGQVKWDCVCDCGGRKAVQSCALTKAQSKSCGCLVKEADHAKTHGLSKSRIYRIYRHMINRCSNRNVESYYLYGERGIKVCEEWLNFEGFYQWSMLNGYKENLSIDRKNNDLGYSPENCQWSTVFEQARNRRNTIGSHEKAKEIRRLRAHGAKNKDIARICGVSRTTVCDVVANKTWAIGERVRLKKPIIYIEHGGEKKMAHEWGKDPRVEVTASTILRRKMQGMSDYDALFSQKKTHFMKQSKA